MSQISQLIPFLILFISSITYNSSLVFDNEPTELHSNYDRESNEIYQKISNALESYTPCTQGNCTCNIKTLKLDLKAFKSGITKPIIESVRERGTKYQIVAHKLYRQRDCMFPGRCSGIEYFIKQLLPELPDMEMIINCRDWPQVNRNWGQYVGPVLSFSKTPEYLDIMYPTWAFWEGGPAISLYPTGIGRWDTHRKSISKAADENFPWEKKKDMGFFRGSRTSHERDPLIRLSRAKPELVDAQYTKNQAWKSPEDTLNAEPATEVSFQDHCQYKYLFNFRGVAASFRFKHLFLCKSLVFHVGNEWTEFFYDSMKPWVHYVPVQADPKIEDLQRLIEFFRHNDDVAREIAQRGFEHIWRHLRMSDVKCYWRHLLHRYARLLKFDIVLDPDLIEIK